MKKFLIFIFVLALFISAYYVRIEFLATKDYNDPSDAREYMFSSGQILQAINSVHSFSDLGKAIPRIFSALDTHNVPLAMLYTSLLDLLFPSSNNVVNALLSAVFVVILFWAGIKLLPFWSAIIVSIIAVFYTPLFAFIYSYMPESFEGYLVPTFIFITIFCSLKASRSNLYSILAGITLGAVALFRIELRMVGIPFVVIWYIIQSGKNKLKYTLLMSLAYFFLVGGWMISSYVFNPQAYYKIYSYGALYHAYNWQYFGWHFDTAPIPGWGLVDILKYIFFQNPLQFLWLEFAQVIRLWFRPATAYIGEYLIPDRILFPTHTFLVSLAIFGLRRIFFDKRFFLLSIFLIWGSLFSYAPEESRRQIPLSALMLLFAGVGISELYYLWRQKSFGKTVFLIIILAGTLMNEKLIYGFLGIFYPQFVTILPLRLFVIAIELFLAFKITQRLLIFDKKRKQIIKNGIVSKIPSAVLLIALSIITAYYWISPSWHEWSTMLLPNNKIQQTIIINKDILSKLKGKKGYLLVDIRDPKAAKNIEVSVNQKSLSKRLSIKELFSPIDIRVIRQFQRGMPRLGWGNVEDSVYSSSAFSNVHQWIVHPISGDTLKEENIVTVRNMSQSHEDAPFIYGDYYFSLLSDMSYGGPTPRILNGTVSFYKFQVDGEIRLPERRIIESVKNISTFFENGQKTAGDLSSSFGVQAGRYRIFLLFPYITRNPEDIF